MLLDLGSFTRWATLSRYFAHQKDTLALDSKIIIIIIIITDLYSAFRSEDTEALIFARYSEILVENHDFFIPPCIRRRR